MTETRRYDAIILGAGQAGVPLATALAGAGQKTALVERVHVGGTCVNEGCTPTKTMIASGRVAYLARRGADYGVETGPVRVNMVQVRERKRQMVASFRGSSERQLAETDNLDLLRGNAAFTGPFTVAVEGGEHGRLELDAGRIFINTGARPAAPQIEGLDRVPALDSTSIMELDTVPGQLLVLGGGYVGLEFGQLFRRLGSEVTIVQRGDQLLSREDPDVAEAVKAILCEDGIDVRLETQAIRAGLARDGRISLTISRDGEESTLEGTHLLVAAGRTPNVEDLNLPAAGVELDDQGFIRVSERLETSVPGIYALGDVKGGPAFTHISYDDFRIIRTNLLEHGEASTAGRLVPYTVFTDPQLGRVGLTEDEARAGGRPIRIAKMPMAHVARALEVGETRGLMKAVVDAESHEILGCAILGIEGGELMAMIEIAMMGRLPYDRLRDGVFAHPTLAESFNNLFAGLAE